MFSTLAVQECERNELQAHVVCSTQNDVRELLTVTGFDFLCLLKESWHLGSYRAVAHIIIWQGSLGVNPGVLIGSF